MKIVLPFAVSLVVLTSLWTGCVTPPQPPGFGITLSADSGIIGVTTLVIEGTSFTPGRRVTIKIHNVPLRADIQKSEYPKANGKFKSEVEIKVEDWWNPQPPGDILVSAYDETFGVTFATIPGDKFVRH